MVYRADPNIDEAVELFCVPIDASAPPITLHEVTEPGAYYFHQTGWLYRIPADGLAMGHSPLMNICSYDECYVTKISDDPWIPVNKAREICSNWDYFVNF